MLKRWIAVLAAIGMMIHTGVVVRHAGMMLANALQAAAQAPADTLQAALDTAQCSATPSALDPATASDKPAPRKPASGYKCPICGGASAAVALADIVVDLTPPRFERGPRVVVRVREAVRQAARLWPPNRGPPLSVV